MTTQGVRHLLAAYADLKVSLRPAQPDSNILRQLRLRETDHSDILRWLLDPDAYHNQGSLFMRAFAEACGINVDPGSAYSVRREARGDASRTDITIYGEREFAIAIEVKVYAAEGDCQCERVYRDLQRSAAELLIPPDRAFAVFLSPGGKSPATAGPEDKWLSCAWDALKQSLRRPISAITSDRLRYAVDDWLETIPTSEEGIMQEFSDTSLLVLEHCSAAAQIVEDWQRLEDELMDLIESAVGRLQAASWWSNGWEQFTYGRPKSAAFVSKGSWEIRYPGGKGRKVEIGARWVKAKAGLQVELYVWCRRNYNQLVQDMLQDELLGSDGFSMRSTYEPILVLSRRFRPPFNSKTWASTADEIYEFIAHYAGVIEQHSSSINAWE